MAHEPGEEWSEATYKHLLEWKEACFTSRDRETGHIEPAMTCQICLLSLVHQQRHVISAGPCPLLQEYGRKNLGKTSPYQQGWPQDPQKGD